MIVTKSAPPREKHIVPKETKLLRQSDKKYLPHVGIYFRTCKFDELDLEYCIDVASRRRFPKSIGKYKLIALKRIPDIWAEPLRPFLKPDVFCIGDISYCREANLAESGVYWPYAKINGTKVSKFAYYLEAIIVHHLKSIGIEYISTSYDPSKQRIKQLERVYLPAEKVVPISEWLKGMGRGIRARFEYMNRQQ